MNKKAYLVVYRESYEGDTVYGVYSTLGKAREACVELNKDKTFPKEFLILEMPVNAAPDFDGYEIVD